MAPDTLRSPGVTNSSPVRTGPRAKWPLWGAAAGVLGITAHLIANPQLGLSEEEQRLGAEQVIALLDRTGYHVAVVAGFLTVACLLVTATAWRRWAERRAPNSLAARLVPNGMIASAGAMILGYGLMGSMAVYLPGGMDEGTFPADGLYSVFMIIDFLPFMAWLGVAVSVAAIAWMAFGDGLVSRWIGAVCGFAALAPFVFAAATGLPGFAGVVGPVAMVVAFTGMAFSRNRPITAV